MLFSLSGPFAVAKGSKEKEIICFLAFPDPRANIAATQIKDWIGQTAERKGRRKRGKKLVFASPNVQQADAQTDVTLVLFAFVANERKQEFWRNKIDYFCVL